MTNFDAVELDPKSYYTNMIDECCKDNNVKKFINGWFLFLDSQHDFGAVYNSMVTKKDTKNDNNNKNNSKETKKDTKTTTDNKINYINDIVIDKIDVKVIKNADLNKNNNNKLDPVNFHFKLPIL